MRAAAMPLVRAGVGPNAITLGGLLGTTAAAVLLARGQLGWGAVVILLSSTADVLDGAVARLRGAPTRFGALLDSVSDRYGELLIYLGLVYRFLTRNDDIGVLLAFGAAAGSVLVSYVKARAEGLGFEAQVGLLSRLERFVILIPSLLAGQASVGLALIAALANLTAIQRLLYVRRQAAAPGSRRSGV